MSIFSICISFFLVNVQMFFYFVFLIASSVLHNVCFESKAFKHLNVLWRMNFIAQNGRMEVNRTSERSRSELKILKSPVISQFGPENHGVSCGDKATPTGPGPCICSKVG